MLFTVKQARMMSELSQEQVAKKLGICRHTYMEYEKNPTLFRIETAIKFSEIVGQPLENIKFYP